MEKMNMKAIGALDNDRSYYSVVKELKIERPLNEIMEKIGFDRLYCGLDEGDDFTECENKIERVVSEKYDFDIIHTSNRVILIVRAKKKEQKIFRELMLEYSNFEE